MQFERSKSGDAIVLEVRGECTVECAKELQATLIEEMEKSDKVLLNLERVTEVDISCLQLLCSTFRSSAKLGKQFLLSGDLPEQFKQLANDAGFSGISGFEGTVG